MAAQIARRLLILGAPGSGKGTIATRISQTYGFSHVVVGDLLRQQILQRSGFFLKRRKIFHFSKCFSFVFQEDSKTIKDHLNKGILLPDDLVLKILTDELEKVREKGFLIDGKNDEEIHREEFPFVFTQVFLER